MPEVDLSPVAQHFPGSTLDSDKQSPKLKIVISLLHFCTSYILLICLLVLLPSRLPVSI